jgi:flagellar export protein FliJ
VSASPTKFRLERVRALREQLEGRSREELASSLSSHLKVEAELESALADVEHARSSVHTTGAARNGAHEIASAHAYYTRMEQVRRSRTVELERATQDVDHRRGQLQHAARERQVLERLKDRHVVAANREALRVEGALLDEIGIARHRRGAGR